MNLLTIALLKHKLRILDTIQRLKGVIVSTRKQKKRFIAGATCPSCKSKDTLMLYFENNVEKMSCVHCGYAESQTDEEVAKATRSEESVIGLFKPE